MFHNSQGTNATDGGHYNIQIKVGLYRICFWEIRPELDFAGFIKQIWPEQETDFTI